MQVETALEQSKEHNHELETKIEQIRKVCTPYLCFSNSGWNVLS